MTVGAAFSVASMLAMARAQARSYPLPQNMLMQTHINMRSQVQQLHMCQHLPALASTCQHMCQHML